jgi:hypothetical protein
MSDHAYLNFSDALREIKNGEKLQRAGWNGKTYPQRTCKLSMACRCALPKQT